MRNLYECLVLEDYEPENYGGAGQGAGFYILIDHKEGFGRGGELDVQIRDTKITIKEKKAPTRGDGHHAYLCIDKPGNYDFDIQADCDIALSIASEKTIRSIMLRTSGKPIEKVYWEIKKCPIIDMSKADVGYFNVDSLTKLQELIGPSTKEGGFRIAKCPNLEFVTLDGILSTPIESTGRLYIRNCKNLVSIAPPQAVGMPMHLEKLPALSAASAKACEDVCKKSNQNFFDLDKR